MKRFKQSVMSLVPFTCAMPAFLWQLCFMIAPLVIIFYFSILNQSGTALTLSHYYDLWNSAYLFIIARSLMLCFATAVSCLVIGYPVAYYLAIRATRFKQVLLFLLTLPFWVNFLVQIYAWYFLLENKGLINWFLIKCGFISQPMLLSNNLGAVFIGMVYCYLPFMIMPLYTVLEKLDTRFMDASYDLGASPWQTFMYVTLPLSYPGIRTGFLLVLIPVFGEFVIPALLGGGKYLLVGSLISYLFLVARDNALGGAFTCLSSVVLFLAIILMYSVLSLWQSRNTFKKEHL